MKEESEKENTTELIKKQTKYLKSIDNNIKFFKWFYIITIIALLLFYLTYIKK